MSGETFSQITCAPCINTTIVAMEDINVEELRAFVLGRFVFNGLHAEVFLGDLRKLV